MSSQKDKFKYCRFHKSHDHNTNNCVELKDAIEGLIKKGRLAEYIRDNKRGREDSLEKKQSRKKTVEVVVKGNDKDTSSEEEEGHEGKLKENCNLKCNGN